MTEKSALDAKILIVDDEPNLLRMIGYILQEEGYQIVVAQNGLEALQKVQTTKPDLMILDIMMPDMNGLEVCEQIRKNPQTMGLPIIMLTAKAQVADKIRGQDAGADEYMVKPISEEEIVARVRSLLKRSRQLNQKQPQKKGLLLAFMGVKGGVGTTTVAVNVALELVNLGKSVLIVEFRSSAGTLGHQLSKISNKSFTEALDADRIHIDLQKLMEQIIQFPSGLKLLLGPQKLQEFRDFGIKQAESMLSALEPQADFIVLDLPSYPSEASQVAIQRSNFIGLVIEPEPICLLTAKATRELLKSWGVNESQVGLVMVVKQAFSVPIRMDEFSTSMGSEIIGIIPPSPDAFNHANKKREPLVISNPECISAEALRKIAHKLAVYQ